jgi:hypothetical protein
VPTACASGAAVGRDLGKLGSLGLFTASGKFPTVTGKLSLVLQRFRCRRAGTDAGAGIGTTAAWVAPVRTEVQSGARGCVRAGSLTAT